MPTTPGDYVTFTPYTTIKSADHNSNYARSVRFQKHTVTYGDLSALTTTSDIELFEASANCMYLGSIMRHTAAFTGGAITSLTVSLGVSSDYTKYSTPFNCFQSPTITAYQATNIFDIFQFNTVTSVRLQAIASGSNLDSLAAGSLDIWIAKSILPS